VNPKLIKYAEWIIAILLSAAVLFVFFVRAAHAGGLWRDECDSLELARLPTFVDVLHNLKFTSFPVLFPTTVRIFTNLFGTSDASLRCFGFLVGVTLLAVAWFNARSSRFDVPLILPALAGLNITFLTDGAWIRGYGLGSVLLVLALGVTAMFIVQPTIIRLVAMFLSFWQATGVPCRITCLQPRLPLSFFSRLVPILATSVSSSGSRALSPSSLLVPSCAPRPAISTDCRSVSNSIPGALRCNRNQHALLSFLSVKNSALIFCIGRGLTETVLCSPNSKSSFHKRSKK